MPEGHTLHRLARDLTETFAGRIVRSGSPQGRFTGAQTLDGRELLQADAVGKHLLVDFGDVLAHVHLGLYGKFVVRRGLEHPVVGQVRWRLEATDAEGVDPSAGHTADLRGPTACELMTPPEVDELMARIGPDPLRDDADPDRAWHRIHRSNAPIATLLMDQKVVGGIGNVYRAEILFRHRVAPMTAGRRLPKVRWQAMWDDLAELMTDGVRTKRIRTVRPEDDVHGSRVYVYRRAGEPCFICGTIVRTRELAGRNLFWCPTCQRAR